MNYKVDVKKPKPEMKTPTSRPMKPAKPKGTGTAKTVRGKAAPKGNKRGY